MKLDPEGKGRDPLTFDRIVDTVSSDNRKHFTNRPRGCRPLVILEEGADRKMVGFDQPLVDHRKHFNVDVVGKVDIIVQCLAGSTSVTTSAAVSTGTVSFLASHYLSLVVFSV